MTDYVRVRHLLRCENVCPGWDDAVLFIFHSIVLTVAGIISVVKTYTHLNSA